jgi:hypothetical protein
MVYADIKKCMEWTTFKTIFVRCDECLWAGTNPEFFTVGGVEGLTLRPYVIHV